MILLLLSIPGLGWERWAALAVGLGAVGAVGWLAWFWQKRQEAEAEEHLMGIAIENEQRRQAMRERFGTDVADGEYAVPLETRAKPEGHDRP